MNLSPLDYGTIVAVVGLVITVVKLYLDQRKARADIELSKRGLEILSSIVTAYKRGQESQQALEKEKLEFQRWKVLAKAAGWALDRFYFEEEEE